MYMEKKINKATLKIMKIFSASEQDAKKILAAIAIVMIAISWFVMGGVLNLDGENKISEKDLKEMGTINN